ncbi:MAG: methyltransferase [Pseudomonadota bacterium]
MSVSTRKQSVPEGCTLDGFLDNQFHVYQPEKGAHRSGLDAVMLAATVPQSFTGLMCDLGSGVGVAGLAALQRTSAGSAVLVENDASLVALARRSLGLAENAELSLRAEVLQADVMLAGAERWKAGLVENTFDHVVTNPPYNSAALQVSPYEQKAGAHAGSPELFEGWFRTACAILKPGGKVSAILRPEDLQSLLVVLAGRFGSIRVLPVHAQRHREATRILVGAIRGGKAPLTLLPPKVLHAADGSFLPDVDAMLRGRQGLCMWP